MMSTPLNSRTRYYLRAMIAVAGILVGNDGLNAQSLGGEGDHGNVMASPAPWVGTHFAVHVTQFPSAFRPTHTSISQRQAEVSVQRDPNAGLQTTRLLKAAGYGAIVGGVGFATLNYAFTTSTPRDEYLLPSLALGALGGAIVGAVVGMLPIW